MKFIFSGLALPATGAWCRIAQINKKTDFQIKLAAIERSKHRRVVALKFTIKTQPIPKGERDRNKRS